MSVLTTRPDIQIEPVYSNFDHELDAGVVAELDADGSKYAQHAAWNFCGYVWRLPDGRWVDQIWRNGSIVAEVFGETVEQAIETANDDFGHE